MVSWKQYHTIHKERTDIILSFLQIILILKLELNEMEYDPLGKAKPFFCLYFYVFQNNYMHDKSKDDIFVLETSAKVYKFQKIWAC